MLARGDARRDERACTDFELLRLHRPGAEPEVAGHRRHLRGARAAGRADRPVRPLPAPAPARRRAGRAGRGVRARGHRRLGGRAGADLARRRAARPDRPPPAAPAARLPAGGGRPGGGLLGRRARASPPTRYAFLTSREWQLQPLYLAAHFITLRLFATMYTRNYLAGVVHLDMPTAHARRGIQLVQGPVGTLVALLVAMPVQPLRLPGARHRQGRRQGRRAAPVRRPTSCSTPCGASNGS